MEDNQQNKIDSPAEIKNKTVQTYAEDMAEVLNDDKGSMVKRIIHDEEARLNEKNNISPESRKNQIFMILGIIFILAAVSTFIVFSMGREAKRVNVEMPFTPMIFNDKTAQVELAGLNKDQVANIVRAEALAATVKAGGVEGIYPRLSKQVLGLREFIALIKGSLIVGSTGLVDNQFLIGVFNGETKDLFILVRMRSMPDIFQSMRNWENKMFYDLHGFFGINISPETNYLLTKNFEDGIMQNKNARILYAEDGQIALMYVYVDDTHLLITENEDAVREVILRLAGSQVKQ